MIMMALSFLLALTLQVAHAQTQQAKIWNPGVAVGQLVVITAEDAATHSPKVKGLNALSIPVFAELPFEMSVVAGAITLKQQNLLSHVQIKSKGRGTPNLDISNLPGGFSNPLFKGFKDGDWVRMELKEEAGVPSITFQASTQAAAQAAYDQRKLVKVELHADISQAKIYRHEELVAGDAIRVGSKAANYAELVRALNTASRTVTRAGYAIPFYYYDQFLKQNPKITAAINSLVNDPLMSKVASVAYREGKLKALQTLMRAPDAVVDEKLLSELITTFDKVRKKDLPARMKLRSSTNSEDLPNFNGAGLYSSAAYEPVNKKGKEKKPEKKKESLREALQEVWASVWSLRAFDERNLYRIPHNQVMMAIQVNQTFPDELVNGVVVTKNVSDQLKGTPGVYIEAQRGDKHNVVEPLPGVKPEQILVTYDPAQPLNVERYKILVIQKSNIANDGKTILPTDNPEAMMKDDEIKDLVVQCFKAQTHMKPLLGRDRADFSLDLEFKVDEAETGTRQVFVKQARPYLN